MSTVELPTPSQLVYGLRAVVSKLSEDGISSFDPSLYHKAAFLTSSFCSHPQIEEVRYPLITLGFSALASLPISHHVSILQDLFTLSTPPTSSRMFLPLSGYLTTVIANPSLPLVTRSDALELLENYLAAFSTSPSFADFASLLSVHLSSILEEINLNPDCYPNTFLSKLEHLADAIQLTCQLISDRLRDFPVNSCDPIAVANWEEDFRSLGSTPIEALSMGGAEVQISGSRSLRRDKKKKQQKKKDKILYEKKVEAMKPKQRTVNPTSEGWD
ncbi:hypothetical protein RCL1_003231 [Eukaryota sp. TZLM3-RCL]